MTDRDAITAQRRETPDFTVGAVSSEPLPANRIAKNRFQGDLRALALLGAFTVVLGWHRFTFDSWLTRFDLYTYFIPWYAYMGDRLRAFDVPGWNPHLFSGTLFAGHPISGWMYGPAMLAFTLLPVLAAFKAMVGLQLLVAGFSTYALARRLGMGPWAALVAGSAYVSGPLVEWNTACCLHFSEFATWLPLALLGVDLSLDRRDRVARLASWFLAGFAISQILAGWVGEGWIYAILLIGGFTLYRALELDRLPVMRRIAVAALTGAATFGLGALLGAAGVWPRLALNAETNLAGGNYGRVGSETLTTPAWSVNYLLTQIAGFGTGYHARAVGISGAILVLALLAPMLARRAFAVPFFAVVTVLAFILTLHTTPIHQIFYLIPQYKDLHEHDPWRVVTAAGIGPPLLAGASIEALQTRIHGPVWLRVATPIPVVLIVIVLLTGNSVSGAISVPVLIAALTATLVVILALSARANRHARIAWIAPLLLFVLLVAQPFGLEATDAWFGWPKDPRWQQRWHPDPAQEQALNREILNTDPNGAGAFLQAEMARSGPFRYAGYGGYGYPNAGRSGFSYMARRTDPNIQAILANGRPMYLGLFDIQGYDPIQLERYTTFMTTLNGAEQDYHTAFVLPTGLNSPLLDLLDVRYLLVDATLPRNRADVIALTQGRHEVFRTNLVVIYERNQEPSHLWIVHSVQSVGAGEAASQIASGQVDPHQTGLVAGKLPSVAPPVDGTVESAKVTDYQPDEMTMKVRLSSPGLLVTSEIMASGWRAYVDGSETPILLTDDLLRGVALPAGDHTVVMKYEPVSLKYGLWISAVSYVLMLAVFGLAAWRAQSRTATELQHMAAN